MRHRKKTKTLDRTATARKALLRILASQLILYEKIQTTESKAKALRPFVERLISRSRTGDLASRRYLMKYLTVENAVKKLLEDVGPRYRARAGGFTRIIKIGQRKGDAARVARIELV